MQIIIVGCGKVGSKLASVLSDEGHDVVVVDNDASGFRDLDTNFSGMVVNGIPIDEDVLKQAGIETADAIAAVTPDDNVNIMVSQLAKEIFKVPKVLARIYNPSRERVFHHFGLDTICPTNLAVDKIRAFLQGENIQESYLFENSSVMFIYEPVTSKQIGTKLNSVKLNKPETYLFGVLRDKRLIFANEDIRLEQNDTLVIAEKTFG